MNSLWLGSLILALFLLPIVAYQVVFRHGGTRGQIFAASVGAGGFGGLFVLLLALAGASASDEVSAGTAALSALLWIIPALAWGLIVGITGLLAHAAGAWFNRRP